MRKPEQKLWDRFRFFLSGYRVSAQRVENRVSNNMPDVLLRFPKHVAWVELKVRERGIIKHWTTGQRKWATEFGQAAGNTWTLIYSTTWNHYYLIPWHKGAQAHKAQSHDELVEVAKWHGAGFNAGLTQKLRRCTWT